VYEEAFAAGLKPDPQLTISEWADRYRRLSGKSASEPGPYRTERTPYLKEIMDALSPAAPVERVVVMKGAQLGFTEAGNNWVGYVIHKSPGPMMVVQPTVELAKRNSKQRIDPLIEESQVLRELVKSPRSRDSGNTVLSKEFPGGVLVMTGANSAVGLRSMAVRYLFLDEIDAYPGDVDGEGDPINLAYARTRTFSRRKVFMVSTPLVTGSSRIEAAFAESDQRRFFVPCPHCGEYQVLKFERLRWPKGEPEKAAYLCAGCEQPISNHQKNRILAHGEWRPEAQGDGRTRGYHLSSLYSPVGWYSWERAADDWEKAQKDVERLKSFVNLVLGESWQERGDAPDWQPLYDRREDYALGSVPQGGLFLTAGADIHPNRIEVEVVAWGRGKESWSVDYRVLMGDTAHADVWRELDAVLDEEFLHASGARLPIRVLCVDAGFNPRITYDWVRNHPQASWGPAGARAAHPKTAVAIKGTARTDRLVLGASSVDAGGKRRGTRLWTLGTPVAKSELYSRLRLVPPTEESGESFPAGYCHFPRYEEDYFRQLTSESLIKGHWVVGPNQRNEALDCFDAETEVLTRAGWKTFPKLNPQDELATVNLETDEIELQHPTHLISRSYRGPMVKIHGRRIDVLVTPGHRMVTYRKEFDRAARKWRFDVPPRITLAKDLTLHHQLKLTGRWQGTPITQAVVPASIKDSDGSEIEPERIIDAGDLAEFTGWYVSEGCRFTGVSRTQGNRRYRVEISQNLGAKFNRIEAVLDRLPWRWHITAHTREPGRKFVCTSKQLYRWLDDCGGKQDTRRVPQWIKEAPPQIIGRLVDAAVCGDGWTQGHFRTLATISRQLADDYQELFLKLGCASNIREVQPKRYCIAGRLGFGVQKQYHVSECRRQKASLDGGGNGQRKYIGRTVPYDGMVYCATVPNGTLICRRGGRSFIAGNCRIYARSAASIYGIDRFTEKHWREMEETLRPADAPEIPLVEMPRAPARRIVRSNWLRN
jgi:phage terminase large subunit GpA-like protein